MSTLDTQRSLSEVTVGRRVGPALAAACLIAAMAVATSSRGVNISALVLTGAGVLLAARLLFVRMVRALLRHRPLWILVAGIGLVVLWLVTGLQRTGSAIDLQGAGGQLLGAYTIAHRVFNAGDGWPWRLGQTPLIVPILTVAAGGGGLVLVADAVRVQLGLGTLGRSPWRMLTARRGGPEQVISRAVPGVALILVSAVLGIGYAHAYAQDNPARQAIIELLFGLWAALLITAPPIVGAWLVLDRDKAGRAREEERLRFAAHLHDSVLQTLALIQRQAQDPAAVARLARRQEHALRAWMAGQIDLAAATLGSALREVVEEVEDERGITVEQTVLGDSRLSAEGEALVAAVREALRNAAEHAPGVPVTLFAQISDTGVEVFVRDAGPGFDISDVPNERRGIRDAIIGRMASVGGSAIVESEPGEGTEVILRLG